MGFAMDSLSCLFVRCLDKTEHLPTPFVKPVAMVFHAMFILNFKIALVSSCDCFCSQALDVVVDVHKEWHE
jgi:hypothetical protein